MLVHLFTISLLLLDGALSSIGLVGVSLGFYVRWLFDGFGLISFQIRVLLFSISSPVRCCCFLLLFVFDFDLLVLLAKCSTVI